MLVRSLTVTESESAIVFYLALAGLAVSAAVLAGGFHVPAAKALVTVIVNIAAINLAAQVVFRLKGIRPRVWWEKTKARRGMRNSVIAWVLTLAALIAMIYLRQVLPA